MLEVIQRVFHQEAQAVAVSGFTGTIMGIDASLNSTGVAVLVPGKVRTFTIGQDASDGTVSRLRYYRSEIEDLVFRYEPDLVVMEGYSYGSRFSRPHAIGELGGIIKLVMLETHKRLLICPPTTLKQFVTGLGKGSKAVIIKEARARWGLLTKQNDEVDAAALAFAGAEYDHHLLMEHGECLRPKRNGKGGLEVLLSGREPN